MTDNHSTDGTYEELKRLSGEYENLIVLRPDRHDLGIGGCWNHAVMSQHCGRFAIQLDSDDLYSGTDTLEKIVQLFHQERCAMVVGTYRMTNFNLEEIPPGVIDHKEWTPDNGRNNALRINGLGAPRAFYTPFCGKYNFQTPAMAKTTRGTGIYTRLQSVASTMSSTSVAVGRTTPMPTSISTR